MYEFSFEDNRVSSPFGPRRAPTKGASTVHKGEDHATPIGTPITAVHAWRVEAYASQVKNGKLAGWGHYVVLSSPEYPGYQVRLAHLTALAPGVSPGDVVPAGQPIAISGNTGTSSGAHVHLELLVGNTAINPTLAPWRRKAAADAQPRRQPSGPAIRPNQTRRPIAQPTAAGRYTIIAGDTLWALAKRVGGARTNAARLTWVERVLAANPGLDPARLQINQTINLPKES